MSINLSIAAAQKSNKKKKGSNQPNNIGFGLNSRKATNTSVLQEESSDDDDDAEEEGGTVRTAVNREIAAEQAALRKRAQDAMSSLPSTTEDMFDYDGQYDAFSASNKSSTASGVSKKEEPKKSRYITSLLKTAQHREREMDVVRERVIAKEQGEEDAREEYKGKEKFITKAYKRKLAEREEWAHEDAKRQLQEEEQDVTKQTSGQAITAGFYGNLHKNVAMGGTTTITTTPQESSLDCDTDTFAKSASHIHSNLDAKQPQDPSETVPSYSDDKTAKPQIVKRSAEEIRAAERIEREEKVASARARYLLRKQARLNSDRPTQ
eukprot:CAMPEP_0198283702 /NCGR_PEP_ID=MMETSP1449-20131203/3278_1 /TAXON_ID=420275 /ORGANISM="Attheya septentrionalis, Strain CCMP2084" /LENGTH=321 /DNA_ID=CAMNT_0043980447 /DNA_START=118 /DNA_END=1083 /DNA_ORIENTATION=+